MVIESLGLYYHMECFRCYVCHIPLSSSLEGIDVRIRNHRLHCQNCFSDERGKCIDALHSFFSFLYLNDSFRGEIKCGLIIIIKIRRTIPLLFCFFFFK